MSLFDQMYPRVAEAKRTYIEHPELFYCPTENCVLAPEHIGEHLIRKPSA